MKTTILIELDFPTGQFAEVELPVTFYASEGYPETHEDPGCPVEVCDIEFDNEEAFQLIRENLAETGPIIEFDKQVAVILIEAELESEEVDTKLLDAANQAAIEYEYEKAEYLYEQKKDADIERHWNKGE